MNQEVKKLWIDVLRSGKYNQCRGECKSSTVPNSFCAVGVICEVYRELSPNLKLEWEYGNLWDSTFGDRYPKKQEAIHAVKRWLGITDTFRIKYKNESIHIVDLNDCEKMSFEEIADILEKEN